MASITYLNAPAESIRPLTSLPNTFRLNKDGNMLQMKMSDVPDER